jgi:hypothetical protein
VCTRKGVVPDRYVALTIASYRAAVRDRATRGYASDMHSAPSAKCVAIAGTVNMGEAFRTVAGAWCCIPAKTPSRNPTLPAWLLTQQSD